jgi:ubiquinone/menaquinone biosynthesis C-methylase UbiE
MDPHNAAELIRAAVPGPGGVWADVGAGDGTFTRALARLLGPSARIYAIDRDRPALASLERWAAQESVQVVPVVADFMKPFELPELGPGGLDGVLFANGLHFSARAEATLSHLAGWVRPGGRVVVVEYDRRPASRWVPYPIPPARLAELAVAANLSSPVVIATRPSAFGGTLYVATAERLGNLPAHTHAASR